MVEQYENREYLLYNYIKLKKSPLEIGKVCGVSERMVRNWLKIYSIPIRLISEVANEKNNN